MSVVSQPNYIYPLIFANLQVRPIRIKNFISPFLNLPAILKPVLYAPLKNLKEGLK